MLLIIRKDNFCFGCFFNSILNGITVIKYFVFETFINYVIFKNNLLVFMFFKLKNCNNRCTAKISKSEDVFGS